MRVNSFRAVTAAWLEEKSSWYEKETGLPGVKCKAL